MAQNETADRSVHSIRPRRIQKWLRWISVGVIVVSIAYVVRSAAIGLSLDDLKSRIEEFGVWAPLAFILLYVIATVLLVPGTLLTLVSGALFGLAGGMLTVSVGSTLGASCAFLIARFLARRQVAALARRSRVYGAIDGAIAEGGWKVVALLRLSPLIPFNLQNYFYGLTPIRFWPYVITSWLAMLPATFMYVYLGHVTGAALEADRRKTLGEWTVLVVGLIATVAATFYLTRIARRKLQEHMDQAPGSHAANETGHGDDEVLSLGVTMVFVAAAVVMAGVAGAVIFSSC